MQTNNFMCTFMNNGRAKARRGSKGPIMRKAILSIATEFNGRRCLIIVCVDSSHSCGRLLKNECSSATIFPETQKGKKQRWVNKEKVKQLRRFK